MNILRAKDVRWVRAGPKTEQDNKTGIKRDNKASIGEDNKVDRRKNDEKNTRE